MQTIGVVAENAHDEISTSNSNNNKKKDEINDTKQQEFMQTRAKGLKKE